MIRTNLKLSMLLWYNCRVEPYACYETAHAKSEAVMIQSKELVAEGMLKHTTLHAGYETTDKAKAYIDYILNNLEYPVNKWVIVDNSK